MQAYMAAANQHDRALACIAVLFIWRGQREIAVSVPKPARQRPILQQLKASGRISARAGTVLQIKCEKRLDTCSHAVATSESHKTRSPPEKPTGSTLRLERLELCENNALALPLQQTGRTCHQGQR